MISSYLPFPLHSGGHVRLYNLIRELSGRHEITLICEKRPHQSDSDIKEVEKICEKVITVERRKQWSLKNILKSGVSRHSFLINGHTHEEMQQKIKEELEKNEFDLIHVETFYILQNLPLHVIARSSAMQNDEAISTKIQFEQGIAALPTVARNDKIPVVLVEHNIEYLVYKRFVDNVPVALRPLLFLDVAKIKREEESAWKKATSLVAVSEDDKKVMNDAGLQANIVPNGVNINQFLLKDLKKEFAKKEKKVLFIGDFKWIQNKDAVKFIIEDVWPEIKRLSLRHSGEERSDDSRIRSKRDSGQARMTDERIKLWVVGRSIPDSIRNLSKDPDIVFDEKSSYLPTEEIFQHASMLLAPIRVGGGTSYKILESMACGTPVVTMQLSADAIHAKDDQEILVGQDAEELASKTTQLLQKKEVYERIARNGRALIEKNYSWKEISKKLERVYEEAIK